MIRTLSLVIALSAACGPSLKQKPVETRRFRASSTDCGQQLAATTFRARGAKWGESVTIDICHPTERDVQVRASVTASSGATYSSVGWRRGPETAASRCRLVDAEVATPSTARANPPGGRGDVAVAGSAAPASTATRKQVLVRAVASGRACPLLNHKRSSINLHVPPVPKGQPIEVLLWTTKPIDVANLVIDLTHNVDVPNVSDEKWQAHLDKQRRKQDRAADSGARFEARDSEPWGPPPPAKAERKPLPAPSANATWIAGYWHFAEGSWHWLSGQWRVPASDFRDGKTLAVDVAPPTLRRETPGPSPFASAVWIGGYWHWDGTGHVWVDGRWAIPPRARSTWRRHRWRKRGAGIVFVPGGWR